MAKTPDLSYGLTNPLQRTNPLTVRAQRSPVAADINFEIGTLWINVNSASADYNDIWMITSVAAGAANWEPMGQDTGGAAPVTKYVVDADGSGDFTTIQLALDAANAAAPDAIIYVRPGTYTESLTLYDGMTVKGDSFDVIITGVHVPPAAGTFVFRGCSLTSATHIFSSAVAGTANVTVEGCFVNVTNGFYLIY